VPITASYEHPAKSGAPTLSSSDSSATGGSTSSQDTSSDALLAVDEPLSKERKNLNNTVLLNIFRFTGVKLFQNEEVYEFFMTEVLYTSAFAMLVFAYLLF
jgi:hypothetical protein